MSIDVDVGVRILPASALDHSSQPVESARPTQIEELVRFAVVPLVGAPGAVLGLAVEPLEARRGGPLDLPIPAIRLGAPLTVLADFAGRLAGLTLPLADHRLSNIRSAGPAVEARLTSGALGALGALPLGPR